MREYQNGFRRVFAGVIFGCASLLDSNVERGADSRADVHENDQLTLAPAAGAGIGKIVADELLSRDIGKKLADALERGLTATTKRWVQTGKGEGYMDEQPDTRSQLQAAMGIMAHMEGEPVKRIIHQHLGANGKVDVLSALQESPALLEAAEREIAKAKFRKSGRTKKAEPAEIVQEPDSK